MTKALQATTKATTNSPVLLLVSSACVSINILAGIFVGLSVKIAALGILVVAPSVIVYAAECVYELVRGARISDSSAGLFICLGVGLMNYLLLLLAFVHA